MTSTTSEAFFDAKYRANPDPWDFAKSPYELDRYARIICALGDRQFALGYEPGCSVGVLTERLAACCARVEACELSPAAVEQARQRCAALPNVRIHHASMRDFVPVGADLYLFSEIGYYFTAPELTALLHRHVEALAPGALLLACHWRGVSEDHILSGDKVHQVIHEVPGLTNEYSETHEHYRLDRWAKREAACSTP